MKCEPMAGMLTGIVEVDETYVGGKPRYRNNEPRDGSRPTRHRGRGTRKTPVLALVQRDGDVRVPVIPNVTAKTLKAAIREHCDAGATISTDGLPSYGGLRSGFADGV